MFGIDWDNLPHPWGKLSQYLGVSVTKQKITQWVNNELHFHHSISACQIPHAISQIFSNGKFFYNEKLACDNLPHSDSWAEIQIYQECVWSTEKMNFYTHY